ncbi:MAG: LysE family translocator [Bacteroidales bacterium]|nr:LysE family translocator [Bacteroidales bacterium]
MDSIQNLSAFITAGILLNLTPGADTLYIITRSISQGKKAGILSVLGISTGGLIHTLAAAFGLSIILSTSAIAFSLVKYAGAGYLIYLGIKTLRQKQAEFTFDLKLSGGINNIAIYRQGMITNLLNPKVALFFLSFLPQFIEPAATHNALPFLVLGGIFMTTGTIWCLIVAVFSSTFTEKLRNNQRISRVLQKISGSIFIILGAKIAMEKAT